jgi:redox-sensitive bicupin YhaK (pirin superfamily)
LPLAHEEDAPSFSHTPAAAIPELREPGATVRVLVGDAFGARSPVPALCQTLYLDVQLAPGARWRLPALAPQLAVYPVDGEVLVGGQSLPARTMGVLPAEQADLQAPASARLVVIGGEPLDAHRHMWWNFVSSRKERILQASEDWKAQRMGTVPGDSEFIPLPPTRFTPPEPLS